MNFPEHQEYSRKLERKLILLFVLALFFLIFLNYLWGALCIKVGVYFLKSAEGWPSISNAFPFLSQVSNSFWDINFFLFIFFLTSFYILIFAYFKWSYLKRNSKDIGKILGALTAPPRFQNHKEKVLINISDEIALAAGVQAPNILILKGQESINAFSLVIAEGDNFVGVTQGALDNCSRDELQAILAHEYSHLMSGDSKLNFLLISLCYGLLCLWLTGKALSSMGSNNRKKEMPTNDLENKSAFMLTYGYDHYLKEEMKKARADSDSDGGGVSEGTIFSIFAIPLMFLGLSGYLMTAAIKASILRQREYLADADAVQFTRDPDALSSVLKKTFSKNYGSKILGFRSDEFNHFFLANPYFSRSTFRFKFLKTHPDVEDRIKRISL